MAFPVDAAQTLTNITTAATSHNINVGSPASGTLLIVLLRFAAAPGTVTFTGYTQLASDSSDASDDTTMVFYRQADGTEGASDALSTVNSVKGAAICHGITGAENPATQAPEISAVAIGTGANALCPLVTPTGGSKDYLFLALAGLDGETQTFTSPVNYTQNNANSGTGGAAATNCRIGSGSRQLTAASENPGTSSSVFSNVAPSNGWSAFTVAVHPPAAAILIEPISVQQAVKRSSYY